MISVVFTRLDLRGTGSGIWVFKGAVFVIFVYLLTLAAEAFGDFIGDEVLLTGLGVVVTYDPSPGILVLVLRIGCM